MTLAGWAQLVALAAAIVITAPPLGRYIAHVYEGGPSKLDRVFDPIENAASTAPAGSTRTASSGGTSTRSR